MYKRLKSISAKIILLTSVILFTQIITAFTSLYYTKVVLNNIKHINELELPITRILNYSNILYSKVNHTEIPKNQRDIENIDSYLAALSLFNTNDINKNTIEKLNNILNELTKVSVKLTDTVVTADNKLTENLLRIFINNMSELNKITSDLTVVIENKKHKVSDMNQSIVQTIIFTSVLGFVLSIALAGLFLKFIQKEMRTSISKLKNAVQSTDNLSITLSKNSMALSSASQEQAAAIQESVSALSEMSSMISQTGQNAKYTLTTSEDALQKSFEGKQIMERMLFSMSSIQKSNVQLQELSQVIDDINTKTSVINDIVFKTQLL
ncbi:MAG: hypothetical protein A2Z20_02915 [Bdellovibrionales bacterium RBG_16_40_8]|nr:MAG: hypothetical protein A2Z20_02915 [Bdellovibrionales bacterium RBG_16_40_8]